MWVSPSTRRWPSWAVRLLLAVTVGWGRTLGALSLGSLMMGAGFQLARASTPSAVPLHHPVELTVSAAPSQVILGQGSGEVRLEIRARRGGAPMNEAQVVVHATAGTVSELTRLGPGHFSARLEPPEEQFPQLAIVSAAEVSSVVRGEAPMVAVTPVSYSAKVNIKGRAEPQARMTVEVGKRRYGPVTVGSDGRFAVPTVVHPGEGWATAVATDRLGNTSRGPINLYLPEVRRLHAFAYPKVLIADGQDRGWVFVTTVSASGEPVAAPVALSGARGEIGAAVSLGPGRTSYPYRAPKALGDGSDAILLRSKRSELKVSLALMAGAPEEVRVAALPRYAPADGRSRMRVRVEVRDAQGNPAVGHDVRVSLDGTATPARGDEAGVYEVELPTRERAGSVAVPVAVVPRTHSCPRPWAGLAPDGTIRVRDVRGILCQLSFAVVDGRGAVVHEGRTTAQGELLLPAHLPPWTSRLVTQGRRGEASDVLWVGQDQVIEPVPILHRTATASWRLPSAVDLKLRVMDGNGADLGLELLVSGLTPSQALQRVVVESNRGTPRVAVEEGQVQVWVAGAGTERPLDVLATDRETGVSTWLRVE